jgi:hypothetical protein
MKYRACKPGGMRLLAKNGLPNGLLTIFQSLTLLMLPELKLS